MKKEWSTTFKRDLENLKTVILTSSNPQEFFPRYVIDNKFFDKHNQILDQSFKDPSTNPYLKFSNFQEFRLISLLNNLNRAKTKNEFHKKYNENQNSSLESDIKSLAGDKPYKSQLIKVNDIVKNSFELTTFIYLLEWLHVISPKENPDRAVKKDRPFFEKTKRKNKNEKFFHPDVLNSDNTDIDKEDMEKFNKIMEVIVTFIRQGKIEEAQKTAEYYNQSFISAMLNGGLPMNDFLLNNANNVEQLLDFDLFPPFMKTKDLSEIREKFKFMKPSQVERNEEIYDKVVGNPNWLLWFYSVYDGCNRQQGLIDDKYSCQIKLLQSFVSGNPSFIEKINPSIYDSLYLLILSMLNLKLINEYTTHDNIQDFHFIDSEYPDFTTDYNRYAKGKNIFDILNVIRSKENYKEATKQDFLLDIEFDLIQLHFIYFSSDEDDKQIFYEKLNNFLVKLITTFKSAEFDAYLSTHYNFIEKKILPDNQSTQNESGNKSTNNKKILKLNYLKILFLGLVSYFGSNQNYFDSELFQTLKGKTRESFIQIYKNFDILITIYFQEHIDFIPNVTSFVYILGFCLDINTVQSNLTNLANFLSVKEPFNYKFLVEEISQHFKKYKEELISNIANGSKIYILPLNICSIDDILENEIKNDQRKISPDDDNKINQIKLLFKDQSLDKLTILKFMMKLCLKFISNNKFLEAENLMREFKNQIDIIEILGHEFKQKNSNLPPEKYFITILEEKSLDDISLKDKIEIDNLVVYFIIILSNIVLDSYSNFKGFTKEVINLSNSGTKTNISISNDLKKKLTAKIDKFLKTFEDFIRLVRIMIINTDIKEILISFFSSSVYEEDIKVILSKWTFQIFKWIADLHTLNIFKELNLTIKDG